MFYIAWFELALSAVETLRPFTNSFFLKLITEVFSIKNKTVFSSFLAFLESNFYCLLAMLSLLQLESILQAFENTICSDPFNTTRKP